eukprot:COSAG01_NODE_11645_length_1889_cov_1.071508_2_plen_120_part_00
MKYRKWLWHLGGSTGSEELHWPPMVTARSRSGAVCPPHVSPDGGIGLGSLSWPPQKSATLFSHHGCVLWSVRQPAPCPAIAAYVLRKTATGPQLQGVGRGPCTQGMSSSDTTIADGESS